MNIPDELRSQVNDYVSKAQQTVINHGNTMTELETQAWLVEPMLEILQWNKGPDVRIGYPIKTKKGRYVADYALQIESKTRILVEVKRVANNLNDTDVMQLMEYAFYEKADVSILTNGNEWRVYEPYHLKDMVFTFNLEDMENSLDNLWLISRASIGSGLLKREINRRYTIDRVHEYIQKNRDGWIRDIVGISTGLTPDGVGRILNKTIMDKASVLNELPPGPTPPIDDPPPDVEWASITDRHTGKSISSFRFHDSVYEVDSWRGMLLKLSSVIYSTHTDEFDKVLDIKGKKRPYYTRDKEELVSPMSIPGTDIFVEGNVSANRTAMFCRQLIGVFGYSDHDLKVNVHVDKIGSEPWLSDGRTWHLVNMMHSKSVEELTDMSKLLLRVSDIITTTLPDVDGPNWNQKYYVSFKVEDTNWVRISTGQSILDIYVKCDTSQFQLDALATRLGMSIFDPDASFSEKLHLPASIRIQEDRGRILLKLKADYSMDDEAFQGFLGDAYKSFVGLKA